MTLKQFKKVSLESSGLRNLGGLTEDDIKDTLNAARVRKPTSTAIQRDFVAAGSLQCKVHDRNLQLELDRIDSDHEGHSELQDDAGLLGCGVVENHAGTTQTVFEESLTICDSKNQISILCTTKLKFKKMSL